MRLLLLPLIVACSGADDGSERSVKVIVESIQGGRIGGVSLSASNAGSVPAVTGSDGVGEVGEAEVGANLIVDGRPAGAFPAMGRPVTLDQLGDAETVFVLPELAELVHGQNDSTIGPFFVDREAVEVARMAEVPVERLPDWMDEVDGIDGTVVLAPCFDVSEPVRTIVVPNPDYAELDLKVRVLDERGEIHSVNAARTELGVELSIDRGGQYLFWF